MQIIAYSYDITFLKNAVSESMTKLREAAQKNGVN